MRKPNRNKSKEAVRVAIWCVFCDGALVRLGGKCPICNRRYKDGKYKKPTPQENED